MSAEEKIAHLTLQIGAGEDRDADELDRLTRQLRYELEELHVDSIEEIRSGPAPQGTRGIDPAVAGALIVAVGSSVIPKLIELVQAWAMRGEDRTVKVKTQVGDRSVEVEFSPQAMSQAELKKLVTTLTGVMEDKK